MKPNGVSKLLTRSVLPSYLTLLQSVGVTAPVTILLSLVGVRGYIMAYDDFRFRFSGGGSLTRDELLLPAATLSDFATPVQEVLRPIFDSLWNAFGYERSFNFDEHGNWKGKLS